MNLSIIIPTLNEEKYIPKLLDSIMEQNYVGEYEVIIVDGKSTEKTKERVEEFKNKIKNLTFIETEKGISFQRNVGAKIATSETLIFLDADTVLPKDFLANTYNYTKNKKNFIILPLILPFNGSFADYIFTFVAYILFSIVRFYKPVTTGMCLITTRHIHSKINGFNEKAVVGEDVDYGFRAIEIGAKYSINFRIKLYASTRRKKHISHFKLAGMWVRWYLDIAKNGAITNPSKYSYEFGKH